MHRYIFDDRTIGDKSMLLHSIFKLILNLIHFIQADFFLSDSDFEASFIFHGQNI